MKSFCKLFSITLVSALAFAMPAASLASGGGSSWRSAPTILDILTRTDGAQAVVAAVLVVDEAGVLEFNIADLLANKRSEVILLAPTNAAFATLLGLESNALDGLSIEEVKNALPGLLPPGVGAAEVAAILLKHVALPKRVNAWNASDRALLRKGEIDVADGSEFPVSIGATGISVNYESTITEADFFAKNGVVHFIDTVILDGLL